ncbi:MAG TPA: efflux RND transporter periplasmic adaptor subunit [Steroidobacteraceae bacterium]
MANEQDLFNPPPESQGSKNFFRRHWKAIAVIVGLLLALIVFTRFIKSKQPLANPRGGRYSSNGAPVSVGTATAASGDIDVKIPALGTVTPLATVTVRTQISGVMQKILFTEGQLVHQGQVLAQIDPRPYQAAVQQMEGNLKRDQAQLADAKLDLVRYENLVKEDSIAQQQLDTQRALVDQDTGTVQSDQGQLQTARVNLIYTSITAPVTGRVGLRQVDQGNYVTPGDANGIVLINEVQPITVIFTIPEDNVSAIAKRVHDGAELTAEALDRTNSQKIADGKLLTFDNTIDITTGTIKLRAQFDNQDNALFPNQFVNIQLLVDTVANQIIIPNSAVRRGAPNGVTSTFVYLVNQDRTVAVRPVTLGVVDGERVAVLSGLKAGDIVVTEGADRLRDGATVLLPKVDGPAGAVAAPKAPAKAGATPGRHKRGNGNGRPPQSS